MTDARVAELLAAVGVTASVPVEITGGDPVLATPFRVGEAAAVAIGAAAGLAGSLWRDRTAEEQEVRVDVTRAAASLVGFGLQELVDRDTPRRVPDLPLVGLYQCADGRWIHLHGAAPHLGDATRRVLGCTDDRNEIARAVSARTSAELEDALAAAHTCGAVVRTAAEWQEHPQGRAVRGLGRLSIERIGDSPPEPVGDGARPLGGERVLDLTRILAGPTHARVLAEHGADVLLVSSPHLYSVEPFVMDTSHGKRSAFLDLDRTDDADRLRALAREASVFAQGYRSGALERRGLGPAELADLRPGIVYVTINCYGDAGPWRERPGWEQLAQSVTGIAVRQGTPERPALIPAAACDYTTGYLAAVGTLAALQRRAAVGGSWHVRASLCQTATWIQALEPPVDPAAAAGLGGVAGLRVESESGWGRLRHLGPVAEMSATPPRWERPTTPLGSHAAAWSA